MGLGMLNQTGIPDTYLIVSDANVYGKEKVRQITCQSFVQTVEKS